MLYSRTAEKRSSRKLRRHTKEPGSNSPGSLLSGYAGSFGVAAPPLSQRSYRTDGGPLVYVLTVIYASTHVPNIELRHRCGFDLDQNVRMLFDVGFQVVGMGYVLEGFP